jgi:hypothetical protein
MYMDDMQYDPYRPQTAQAHWGGVPPPTVTRASMAPGGHLVGVQPLPECSVVTQNSVTQQLYNAQVGGWVGFWCSSHICKCSMAELVQSATNHRSEFSA